MTDINKESTSLLVQNKKASSVATPELRLGDLSLLTEHERQQILVDWNATEQAYPYEQCLHQLFEAQSARTPSDPALIFENSCMTYQELNVRANQLAHYLQHLGVGPDVLVGVYMERSFEMVIGLLGILKAGGAYVPLDPTYPSERVAFMLEDMATATPDRQLVLLTQTHLISQLPAHSAHVLCLDAENASRSIQETSNPLCLATADNLAYVIYTSGSTGKPKGAMNTHRGINNRLLWMQDAYQLTSADAVLQKTPFSFDVSVWEFFWPLLTGARLVIARPEGHKDSTYLVSLIQEQQITTLHFVPSMLQVFLEEPDLEACSSLRQVICSGEALPYKLQERFFAHLPAALHNLYGPTEAAIDVTFWACQRNSERTIVPIGYPIANTQLYILNSYGQPVPVGVQGELYIGGIGVARGYLNRPELTAERFVHDPFSAQPKARLYKTGDIARYLPDGAIECLGRLDQQIKLRGFRIELGEIETVLAHYPAVREAVVTVYEESPEDKRLAAYVVFHKELNATVTELQQHMQQHLPPYMVPSLFMVLSAFPLTSSGKVDRRALPVPDRVRSDLNQPFVAPCTMLEAVIADIWSHVLGIDQVGVNDNFFALGGHSLLAMRVITQLRANLQIELPLRNFFAAPTVAQFAKLVDSRTTTQNARLLPSIQALPRERYTHTSPHTLPQDAVVLPCSFAQQRLWFMDQLDPHNPAYTIPATMHFQGKLDLSALQQSLTTLAQRHEVLRTTFVAFDGQPMQVIIPVTSFTLNIEQASEDEYEAAITQEAAKPFDLAQGPLWHVTFFQLAPEHFTLFLSIHHSIADGWSIGLFFQELTTLYTAFSTGSASSLSDLPAQYADFAAWQRANLQEERLTEHLHYWQQHLTGAPERLELPTDFMRPLVPTHKGTTYTFALSHQLTEALRGLSRQEGVTLYITLMAAFQILLHRYTGQDDLIVGTALADRSQPEVQSLMGLFLHTVALRTNFEGNPTVQELLLRVREVVLDAHAHQDLPFERLVQELHLQRSMDYSPLFQVSLQLDPPSSVSSMQWTLTRMSTSTTATKFDLSLELEDHPDGLIGHLEYSTDLFTEHTIARMATHWQTLLESMVADPTQQVGLLPMLTEEERQYLLVDLNDTSMPYPAEQSLHELFEAQVARTPANVAAVFEESHLTYQELNARSNQFARYLQSLGVGPDLLVGICIERSLDMLVALLGILKAGGTYIPLDPAYPSERLAFMLMDSQAAALVTQQHLLERLPQSTTIDTVICLDREWQTIEQESPENLECLVSGEDPAYILYTSGSTGTPKGVLGTHRASLNRFNWMWRTYPFAVGEVCCQKTTLSFVDSVWEIFGPLLQGIPNVIIPDMVVKDPPLFLQTLATQRVTRIVLVPSLLRVLLDSETSLQERVPDLKYWICSGETLPLELAQRFEQQLPGRILLNLYGSSEVAADATFYEVKSISGLACVPIGHPIDNTQIYLLDKHMQLVPIGIPGELYVGGDGLALGYFKRAELTAAKFVAHPFSTQPEALLYKTGDWARYLPDGTIEYLGRLDHQVKLRGMRIELGEIESVLSQHPMVHEAVVSVREDVPGDQRLVAYVVLLADKTLATDELRQHLATHLPAYMLPSTYVYLAALPLTPNGKVDRRALPSPDTTIREAGTMTYIAPSLTVHHQLVQIWEELFELRPIGIRDDFFTLGGHSFLAVRLMARIEQVFGKTLPLSTLFANATIEHLAIALHTETHDSATTRTPITSIHPGGSKRPFFFLHGDWEGKGLYCLKLAQTLGEEQPFYILETYQYSDLNVLPTLEEVAAAHLAVIRAIQPEGPYILGGWCNGALFAYEMAQQLHTAGQSVEMLVLMDPGSSSPSGRFLNKFIRRLKYLKQTHQVDWFLRLLHLYEYVRLAGERKEHAALQREAEKAGNQAEIGTPHPNFQSPLPSRKKLRANYLSIFNWWASSYTLEPYTGKIAVFWTKEDDAKRRKDWESFLANKKDVEVYMVPGTHITSRTKYVGALGESLRDCLNKTNSTKFP